MGRFVLLIIALFILVLLARGALSKRRRGPSREAAAATAELVRCAHCGTHVPKAEAHVAGEQHFCSDEHRRRGARRP